MKTIVFDLGGTVIKSNAFNFEKGLKKLHTVLAPNTDFSLWLKRSQSLYPYTYQTRKNHLLEIPLQQYLKFFLNGLNLEGDYQQLELMFLEAAEDIEVISGIKECLATLKNKKYQIIALSNSTFSSYALQHQLAQIGVLAYFDCVYSSAELLVRKPCPLLFEQIMLLRNLKPEDCYMVGNDLACDIEPAQQIGIKAFWYHETEEKSDIISFHDYQQLPLLID